MKPKIHIRHSLSDNGSSVINQFVANECFNKRLKSDNIRTEKQNLILMGKAKRMKQKSQLARVVFENRKMRESEEEGGGWGMIDELDFEAVS